MFSHTLILAEAAQNAAAPSDAPGGFWELLNGLGITLPNLLAQIVNFTVVAFLLYKFAWKPVLATLGERHQKIESGLQYAEDMKVQLAAAQQETAKLLKGAQLEASKIIEESRKTAKDFADRIQKEAADRANDQFAKAQQAIELEHKKMLADARSEIARLVVSTTERVLAKKLSDADRAGYNEAAAKELTNA
jgi:F-type H+-transporting ATPase subunit b